MPSPEQTALQPVLRDIHRYWFGDLASPTAKNPEKAAIWFRQSDETDAHIRDTYGRYIAPAAAIDWDLDALSREEQIGARRPSRPVPAQHLPHLRRGLRHRREGARNRTASSSTAASTGSTSRNRTFIAVPFEHSEDIADQDFALLLVARMAVEAPEDWKDERARQPRLLHQAPRDHPEVRALPPPERRARPRSTPEEIEFLKGGRGF